MIYPLMNGVLMNKTLDAILKSQESNLSVEQILLNFAFAFVLGLIIYISYRFSHSSAVYSARFNVSLLMLTLITTLIMNVIGNNIALSLGMVGALSIIRFRTAVKDPRDTTYIFWCIAVGIACGVSYYTLALIGSAVIFVTMLVMGTIKTNNRYLLIIRGNEEAADEAETKVMVSSQGKAVLRVKNLKSGNCELIFEITSNLLNKMKKNDIRIENELAALKGVEAVDLVCQNEEMSR